MKLVQKKRNIKKAIIPIVILVLVFLGLLGWTYKNLIIDFIKDQISSIQKQEPGEKWVRGLEDIPVYPKSTFLFESSRESVEVRNMLADGRSAYILSNGDTFSDAIEFYKKELPKYGWSFVLEVSEEDSSKKAGFYWIKDKEGLWLYEQIHDIWYQIITAKEATSGLSDLVALENRQYYDEQSMMLLSSVVQTDWDFNYPDSWKPEHRNSAHSNGLDILFKYALGGFEIRIEDLGTSLGSSLDEVATNYLNALNENQASGDKFKIVQGETSDKNEENSSLGPEEVSLGLSNSDPSGYSQIKIGQIDALEMALAKSNSNGKAFVSILQHPQNNRFYSVANIIGDREFYEYIKENIKPI